MRVSIRFEGSSHVGLCWERFLVPACLFFADTDSFHHGLPAGHEGEGADEPAALPAGVRGVSAGQAAGGDQRVCTICVCGIRNGRAYCPLRPPIRLRPAVRSARGARQEEHARHGRKAAGALRRISDHALSLPSLPRPQPQIPCAILLDAQSSLDCGHCYTAVLPSVND